MTDAREPDSSAAWRSPDLEIKIGISSCLLGEAVRYDGGHQKDSYITGALSRHFTFVSVCPEMELGLGAPRETLRLVGDATAPRLVATQSGTDLTQAMDTYARARVGALGGLSGYILKRASPSCGMERVKVYPDAGMLSRSGTGLFARRLMDAYPRLPVASSATSDVDSCPGGAHHAHQSRRGAVRRGLCRRPDLPLAPPQGAHASERLNARPHGRFPSSLPAPRVASREPLPTA
jgi:uncharacterized protein YbbK (DUF523 family)